MKLSSDYYRYSDASGGPLTPGEVGTIVKSSGNRHYVEAKDRKWWYDSQALVICESDDNDEFEHCDKFEDAVKMLKSASAKFTADFRLNSRIEALTYNAGPEGAPKYIVEVDQSSYLEVPEGAFLGCNLAIGGQSVDRQRICGYTIIMDVSLDIDKLAQNGAVLVSFQWPAFSNDENTGRILVGKDGSVRPSIAGFNESESTAVRVRSNQWHRILLSRSPQERKLATYIDGKCTI